MKRISYRKNNLDEVPNTGKKHQSSQEKIRICYFIVPVDMNLTQLNNRFKKKQDSESIFGFLFYGSKLVSFT